MDAPSRELELTESSFVEQREYNMGILTKLMALETCISIGDLGDACSALSQRKRFGISTLKTERSFVRDLATDPDAEAIIRPVIALARNPKLTATTDDTETLQGRTRVRALVCPWDQGYLLERTIPVDGLTHRCLGRSGPALPVQSGQNRDAPALR